MSFIKSRIKTIALKLSVLALIFVFWFIPITNSNLSDQETSTGNTFTAGCWGPPSIPTLTYPFDNTHAGLGSTWDLNPYMDWEDSSFVCSGETVEYQYESYRDVGLTSLAYRSSWLSQSSIPAPNIPEGAYYWRVRARDSQEISSFSPPWLLIVDRTAPPTPFLISPGNNIALNNQGLTQTWQQVFDNLSPEVYYDYESYNDAALTSLRWAALFSNSSHGNGQIITKPAPGAPNGYVYWRVRAIDQAGNTSPWSIVWNFLIDNSLPNPVFIGPGSSISGIVINEILPNPLGSDEALKPDGEWVELYNTAGVDINVANWYLYDAVNQGILISPTNTNTGNTIVPANGFLAVYLNATYPLGWLNNTGDTVKLYNNHISIGVLIDSYAYLGPVPEGKSIARIPDGAGPWYDPIPTPGGPNRLELTPSNSNTSTNLNLLVNHHQASFTLTGEGLTLFNSLDYTLTYQSDSQAEAITGSLNIDDQSIIEKTDLILGTCSTGGTCVYHQNITNIKLKVILQGLITRTLTATLEQ